MIPGPSCYTPKTFTNIGDNKNGAFLIGKTGGDLSEAVK